MKTFTPYLRLVIAFPVIVLALMWCAAREKEQETGSKDKEL